MTPLTCNVGNFCISFQHITRRRVGEREGENKQIIYGIFLFKILLKPLLLSLSLLIAEEISSIS